MRRSNRQKKTRIISDLGTIRKSRATGKCIIKKTCQDGRIGNSPTERAVRGSFSNIVDHLAFINLLQYTLTTVAAMMKERTSMVIRKLAIEQNKNVQLGKYHVTFMC